MVKTLYPNDTVIHHYRASWLGRLELDVYVVNANIGFEYQGIQHYKPQKQWGGIESFKRGQERDAEKKRRCMEHGTRIIEIRYDENIAEDLIKQKLQFPYAYIG